MATEDITSTQPAGLTIYARFVKGDGTVFDFDDNTWQTSPAQPKLSLTERTSIGDSGLSVYAGTINLSLLNSSSTPASIVVQIIDDLSVDVIRDDGFMHVMYGEVVQGKAARQELIKDKVDNLPADPASASTIAGLIAALNNLDKATVKEILFTDITSELPQQTPPVNAALAVQLRYLFQYFMFLRKMTEDELSMWNTAEDTKIARAVVSDDGTTAEKGGLVSGA